MHQASRLCPSALKLSEDPGCAHHGNQDHGLNLRFQGQVLLRGKCSIRSLTEQEPDGESKQLETDLILKLCLRVYSNFERRKTSDMCTGKGASLPPQTASLATLPLNLSQSLKRSSRCRPPPT